MVSSIPLIFSSHAMCNLRFRMVVIETKSQILEMNAHEHSMNKSPPITASIYEGHMKLKPLLYPCTVEFSLMCLTVRILLKLNEKMISSSYSFSFGKISAKHSRIKHRIKHRRRMFLWSIVMHRSKVYSLE